MADNQNFILAIVLSIAVLIGWQYFIAGPQMERAREAAVEGQPPQASQPSQPGDTSAPVPAPTTGDGQLPPVTASPVTPSEPVTPTGLTRDAALETSPRVAIATKQSRGYGIAGLALSLLTALLWLVPLLICL